MVETGPNPSTVRYVGSEVERMAAELGLDEQSVENALSIYARALREGFEFARLDDISTACVYVVARHTHAASFEEIADAARIDRNRIYTVASRLLANLGLEPPLPDPVELVRSACEELGLSAHVDDVIVIVEDVTDDPGDDLIGRTPSAVAAGAIYAGSNAYDYEVTMWEIATVLPVTEMTIKNVYPLVEDEMSVDVDPANRKFRDVDAALATLLNDLSLDAAVATDVEQAVSDDRPDQTTKMSEAGIVLGAIYAILRRRDSESPYADVETLSEYANASPLTIRKHARRFSDE